MNRQGGQFDSENIVLHFCNHCIFVCFNIMLCKISVTKAADLPSVSGMSQLQHPSQAVKGLLLPASGV